MNLTNEGINYGLRLHIHRRFSIWSLNFQGGYRAVVDRCKPGDEVYLELEWIAVAHTPQVQHLVAQFVLKEVIESAVDRCEPGDEVLFGVGYGRIIRAASIQGTCEGQIKP